MLKTQVITFFIMLWCGLVVIPEAQSAPLTVIKKAPAKRALKLYSDVARYHYLLGDYVYGYIHQSIAEKNTQLSAVDSPEVWQASLYMDANMHLRAFSILEARLADNSQQEFSTDFRINIWLMMAEKLYQHSDFERATRALSYLNDIEPSLLPENYHYLKVQLLLAKGDIAAATVSMQPIPRYSILRRYLTYNLAMAYIARQQYEGATVLLENVVTISGPVKVEPVLLAIIDKAYLALGYLHNQLDRSSQAITYFKAISLAGMETEAAMLGYGWALLKSEQFAPALAIWQKLASQSVITPFVRESFIAIPYAFDLLGDKQSAISAYQKAISRLQEQEQALTNEMEATKDPKYLPGLLIKETNQNTNQSQQPFKGDKFYLRLPNIVNTYDVVAKSSFQQGIANLEDIYVVVDLLEKLAKDLDKLNEDVYQQQASSLGKPQQAVEKQMTPSEIRLAKFREKLNRLKKQDRGHLEVQKVLPKLELVAQTKQQFDLLHKQVKAKLAEAKRVQTQLGSLLAVDIYTMLEQQRENVRNYLLTARMALARYNDEALFNRAPVSSGNINRNLSVLGEVSE